MKKSQNRTAKTSNSKQTKGWNEHASTIHYTHVYTPFCNILNKYTLFQPLATYILQHSQSQSPKIILKIPSIPSPSPGMLHLIDLLRLQAPWRLQAVARPGRHRRRGHPGALRVVRGRHRGHRVARHRVGTRRVGLAQPGAVEAWGSEVEGLTSVDLQTSGRFQWVFQISCEYHMGSHMFG